MQTTVTITLEEKETFEDAMRALVGSRCQCKPGEAPKAEAEPEAAADEAPSAPKAGVKKKGAKPKEAPKEEAAAEEPKASDGSEVTFEDMRRVAMAKINGGKRDEVEAVLKPHGGSLSQVAEDARAEVLEALEAL